MEIISNIVESLKKILEEDKLQPQPLFLKTSENLILNIARKVVQEKKKTFLIGITGESASGKTVFVDNTIKACVKGNGSAATNQSLIKSSNIDAEGEKTEGIYTVIRCDDYYKDTSKELKEAGSYEELFKTGFSFDTPDVIDLDLMKHHLIQLKSGHQITSPKYDFVTCESHPNGDIKKPAKVILTEGLYVLNEGVRDVMDVKVYVYTPLEVIKDRWYKRAAQRGKSGAAADLQFADVNKTAQQYIRPAYQISDAVINGMVSQEYIQEITDKIFNTLKEIV